MIKKSQLNTLPEQSQFWSLLSSILNPNARSYPSPKMLRIQTDGWTGTTIITMYTLKHGHSLSKSVGGY